MNFSRRRDLAVGILISVGILGCSTGSKRIIVSNCASDPLTESFQCVDRDGMGKIVPWKDTAGYVCRPADDDQILNEAAYRK